MKETRLIIDVQILGNCANTKDRNLAPNGAQFILFANACPFSLIYAPVLLSLYFPIFYWRLLILNGFILVN